MAFASMTKRSAGYVVPASEWNQLIDNDNYLKTQTDAQISLNGWVSPGVTWTYASATTITVPAGAALIYSVGDKIKLTANSVVLYAYIVTVADTLLTVAGNALTNHTFTANYYSKVTSPLGFPSYFAWTPVETGFSAAPTLEAAKFSMSGRTVTVTVTHTAPGTSNATTYTINNLPITAVRLFGPGGYAIDNSVPVTEGLVEVAGAYAVFYKTAVGAWTNSGSKMMDFSITYFAA